jgi:hypothetical protein
MVSHRQRNKRDKASAQERQGQGMPCPRFREIPFLWGTALPGGEPKRCSLHGCADERVFDLENDERGV